MEFMFSGFETDADIEFFFLTRNECRLFLHDQREFSIEEVKAFMSINKSYRLVRLGSERIGYFRINQKDEVTWQIGADLSARFRGKGIAKKMYSAFVSQVLSPNGCKYLELRVIKANTIAINLYLGLGFEVIEETELDYKMRALASEVVKNG